jgi:hypothetical protein
MSSSFYPGDGLIIRGCCVVDEVCRCGHLRSEHFHSVEDFSVVINLAWIPTATLAPNKVDARMP